jgi:tetratricopeptide (TPR) repeat protein
MKRLLTLVAVSIVVLITGCGSKKLIEIKSPVLEAAERLEHRGVAAYAKGDFVGAAKDFQTAIYAYESLAMVDAAANAQLSLARIDADGGRVAEALIRVNGVLRLASLSTPIAPATMLLAQGRAAALYLQQKDLNAAGLALAAAEDLCTSTCEAISALATLRANWNLALGNAAAAKAKANAALSLASDSSDKANALRTLAHIGLAQGLHAEAIQNVALALALDQQLGASLRVMADLDLLASIHAKAGDAQKAAQYTELSRAAAAARLHLGGK